MIVKFKSLTVEGFRTFASKQTFQLDRPAGVYLLVGDNQVDPELEGNGTGKSTMPGDALTWLWFGKTTRGIHGPPIVSWFPHDSTYVESELEIDDIPTVIKRSQSPNSFLFNDKEITNEDIQRQFKIDYDQALVSIILGQKSNSFIELTPKYRLELLSSILSLDLWESCADVASKRNDAHLKKIQNLEAEEKSLGNQSLQVKETIKKTKERSSEFITSQQEQITEIHLQIRAVAKLRQDLQTKTNPPEIAKLQNELTALDDKIVYETDYLDKLKTRTGQTTLAKQKIELERSQLSKQYKKWVDIIDECPYCNQSVSNEIIQKNKAEIAKERGQSRDEYNRLLQEEAAHKMDIINHHDLVIDLKQDRKKKENALESFKDESIKIEKQTLKAQTDLDHLKETLGIIASTINPYVEQLTEQETQLKSLQDQAISIRNHISTNLTEQKKISWWIKGFKDLRLWIIKLALDSLASITNQTLARLGLSSWSLEFDIERQTAKGGTNRGLNVTIHNQLTNERWPAEVYSGGELQRIKISTAWGLAFLVESYSGFRCNVLLLDEPSIYLSPTGLNQLLEFLHDEAHQTNKAIYVIDHHSLESPFFDGTIKLVKTNNGTTIRDSI